MTLQDMKAEANKSTEEKIRDMVEERNFIGAQQLYLENICKQRLDLIRL